jgi:hypothetical protein
LFIFPQWVDLLDGIDSFSHILVLYWPHLIDPKRRICEKPILWAVKICHCRAYLRPAVRHGRIRFWCRRCFCLNGPYILSK